jgi:sec-independent protein translocase protein TatB
MEPVRAKCARSQMFDIGWSELMIVAAVAIVVVGPKDLPVLLRTIGRYFGIVKRQADEFRSQFDEALRESEFADLKKEFEDIGQDTENSIHNLETGLHDDFQDVAREMDDAAASAARQPPPDDDIVSLDDGEPDADPSELAELADIDTDEPDPAVSEDTPVQPPTTKPVNGHDPDPTAETAGAPHQRDDAPKTGT